MVSFADLSDGPKMFRDNFGPKWGPRLWQAFFIIAVIAILALFLGEIGGFAKSFYKNISEWVPNKPTVRSDAPAMPSPPAVGRTPDRTFVELTPVDLMNLYHDRTGYQADQLFAAYRNKWMHISGEVKDIMAFGQGLQIVYMPNGFMSVLLRFEPQWNDQLSVFQPKQHFLADCKIINAGVSGSIFENCELVTLHP